MRDGWDLVGGKEIASHARVTIFEKSYKNKFVLRKIAHEQLDSPQGKGCYWDEHEIENTISGECKSFSQWEWADFDSGKIVFTQNGCIYRATPSANPPEKAKLVCDLNNMKFEPIEAPY